MNKPNEKKEIVNFMGETWEKENLELFKKALVEGLNRRIDRELATSENIPDSIVKKK